MVFTPTFRPKLISAMYTRQLLEDGQTPKIQNVSSPLRMFDGFTCLKYEM